MYEDDRRGSVEHSRRRVPRYQLKTVANSAPEFANHEQDIIRQSFSTGNHTWMKECLPVELAPDAVNMLRRQRMERNRLAEPIPQPFSKMTQLWGGGYYQEFEYIPDEYERKRNFEQELRQNSTEKREKIANHEWRYTSQERKLKYEPMVTDTRTKETYPYLGGDKDAELEASKQWLRSGTLSSRARGLQESQQPTESFLAGKGRGLEDDGRTSRMTLPTIVMRLQKRVDADWEGCTVVVSATDQDLIQVAFHMATVDSERGVVAYMNVLAKDVDLLGSLGIRKVSQLWGMKRDFAAESAPEYAGQPSEGKPGEHIWMFFLLAPKWVRMRPTDAYYTVHPRSQGSAFRMSMAGSSVLLSLGSSVLDSASDPLRRKEPSRGGSSTGLSKADSGPPTSRSLPPSGPGATPRRLDVSVIEQAVGLLPAIREPRP